jgi:hypothetical protein
VCRTIDAQGGLRFDHASDAAVIAPERHTRHGSWSDPKRSNANGLTVLWCIRGLE